MIAKKNVPLLLIGFGCLALVLCGWPAGLTAWAESPPSVDGMVRGAAPWQPAAPVQQIHEDWMLQDFGADKPRAFKSTTSAELEQRAIRSVLAELGSGGEPLRRRLRQLAEAGRPASDPAWRQLYLDACARRRHGRLKPLREKYPRIVYTKHYCIGGSHYAYTENPTDAQSAERGRSNPDWRMGAALCLMEILPGGQVQSRTLLEEPDGLIRDPDVSYDGRRIVFSRRDTATEDDFHLYELDMATGRVGQLTFGLGFADIEPAWLPDDQIVFVSTRCMQITDCFWPDVANLYMCDRDGSFLRRIGFDQVTTNYPKVLPDGRISYTRWDYNDRGQIFPQGLFVMNPDGTGQTALYGNNSWFPTSILHARGIPNSHKLVAVASGHHCHQRGKLVLVDPQRGSEEGAGIQLIAPVRPTPPEQVDAYGQQGDQFQYPYPLDERHFLVTYDPLGSPNKKYRRPYGIYFMDIDGRRELLAWDPNISCNQPVPLAPRSRPLPRASQVDYTQAEGTYYIQDIYAGQGLAGVPRGTIRRVRVVALEYRAAGIASNNSRGPAGGALSSTPVSIGNGCWDVKVVLGTAPVYDDGSAWFSVPARTPVYFQALDDRNRAVQTMRSWSTLQPGENASCVGCHERKNATALLSGITMAALRGPQPLRPFYGPPRGFSFPKEIQPILDQHCVQCHYDRSQAVDWQRPAVPRGPLARRAFSLLGNTTDDPHAGRCWSDSYLALTAATLKSSRAAWQGHPNRLVNWITAQSEPSPLPPRHAGSTRSALLELLQQGHGGAELSPAEMEKIACWMDLGVPYCGDYREANIWTERQRAEYAYYEAKRARMRQIEQMHLDDFLARRRGQPGLAAIPTFDAGGPQRKRAFITNYLNHQLPVFGRQQGSANRYRNLALNPHDAPGAARCYPHALSNSVHAGRAWFAPCNAIDGKTDNRGHGPSYPSWGPQKRTDLWWQVDFGRPVEIDKVVIYLRADFPHDDCWRTATIRFSDGGQIPIRLKKTAEPQTFSFPRRVVSWLKLTDLTEPMPPDWCGLTEVQVWGRDVPTETP